MGKELAGLGNKAGPAGCLTSPGGAGIGTQAGSAATATVRPRKSPIVDNSNTIPPHLREHWPTDALRAREIIAVRIFTSLVRDRAKGIFRDTFLVQRGRG